MMQAPVVEENILFSYETLTALYQKLDFSSRSKTLELFMATDTPFPKNNPPFPPSTFLDRTQHIVTVLSYLLGYHSNQWIDESMIGFLSILSSDSKPSIMFDFSQFLEDSIHDQFFKFHTEEVFKYTSVIVYMFVYF